MNGQLNFRVIGDLEVAVDDVPIRLGGARQQELLARMLLDANQPVAAEQLLEDIWPGGPSAKVLPVTVTRLRQALGAAAWRLQTRTCGYAIEVHEGELDIAVFEHQVQASLEFLTAGDPDRALAATTRALSLWRGAPLAGLHQHDWARRAADRLADLRLEALDTHFEALLELERYGAVVPDLRALVAANPAGERPCRQLMLALYHEGRQPEALAVFQETRRFLTEEYGLEPGARLRELQLAILRQDLN